MAQFIANNKQNLASVLPPSVPDTFMQDPYQIQAVVQKPVKYVENVWGQEMRTDPRNKNFEKEMSFWPKFGRDRLVTGGLPYQAHPRMLRKSTERMIPIDTTLGCSRACFNEALAQAGPHYLRYFPVWDAFPMKPSTGDVTKDPRYGMTTRRFTFPFKSPGI